MWTRPIRLLVLLLVVGGLCVGPAGAQDEGPPEVEGYGEVPTIPAVESIFSDGLRAYEQGKYEVSLRRFENVLSEYRFNRRTTIALLLAGHSRFQLGRFEEAARTYDRLIEEYPESRYVSEAERARAIAREEIAGPGPQRRRTFTVGVALPLGEEHRAFTQALFNGIRVAVDEHNTDSTRSFVRMVFADTGARPDRARAAVRRLIERDSVDLVLGPLYSESEVIPAAEVAENHGVPLIAPMATDVGVTLGREYAFQVNPPLATRARLLADSLTSMLNVDRVGIVAQFGTDGERLAKAFQSGLIRSDTVGAPELLQAGRTGLGGGPADTSLAGSARRTAAGDSVQMPRRDGAPTTSQGPPSGPSPDTLGPVGSDTLGGAFRGSLGARDTTARADTSGAPADTADASAAADSLLRMGGRTIVRASGDTLEIPFFRLIKSSSDWYRLTRYLEPDTVRSVDALFMPITGPNAESLADAALGSVARMIPNRALYPRVLGNAVWGGLTSAQQGSQFRVTFEESFWTGSATPALVRFRRRYRSLAGEAPNRLGYVGYDVARFVTERLLGPAGRRSGSAGSLPEASGRGEEASEEASEEGETGDLADRIRSTRSFEGVGVRVDFDGGQINQGLFFLQYRTQGIVRLR